MLISAWPPAFGATLAVFRFAATCFAAAFFATAFLAAGFFATAFLAAAFFTGFFTAFVNFFVFFAIVIALPVLLAQRNHRLTGGLAFRVEHRKVGGRELGPSRHHGR